MVTWTLRRDAHSFALSFADLFIHSLAHSPSKYILGAYYVLILSMYPNDTEVNKMNKILAFLELELQWGRQTVN